jgi:antitoxin component of MazEF toxin-antitoxin module
MVKIYKQKNGRFVVYLPNEVLKDLNLSETDEVDFFKLNKQSFIFAKKSDVSALLIEKQQESEKENDAKKDIQQKKDDSREKITPDELRVLKKLDTVRYPDRSKKTVDRILDSSDQKILQDLIKKNAVYIFQGKSVKEPLYSISNDIYNDFLMRKKQQGNENKPSKQFIEFKPRLGEIKQKFGSNNENVELLEKNGFIVLQTEAEASSLSIALEESIRQGFVIGTRSFNKKFYIVLRSFFDAYSGNVIKVIRAGNNKIEDIAKETNINPDGIRAIVYLLLESGDVSEKKKDVFVLA